MQAEHLVDKVTVTFYTEVMTNLYKSCRLCPRNCGVNRLEGKTGYCGETALLRIGAAVIHKGEEPPLVGEGGSGTVFISGCNLGCSFCQNYQISQEGLGKAVSPQEFADICAALRDKGAENINIVTGSHAVPGIIEGFDTMRKAGVALPILWNSSGYESIEALDLISEYADIYLPDLKTLDRDIAAKFFNAPDYPETASAAILKMLEAKKKSRVFIRHLILPGYLESTRSVLRWFAENAKDRALLSLMTQYTPVPGHKPMPNGYLTEDDYKTVLNWLDDFKIDDGFCQELVTGNDWLPDFRRTNPFSSELSLPVFNLRS